MQKESDLPINAQDIYCRGENPFCEGSLNRQRFASTDAIWWSCWRPRYTHRCFLSYSKELRSSVGDRRWCRCLAMGQCFCGTGPTTWAPVGSQASVNEHVVRRQISHDSPETIADPNRSIDQVSIRRHNSQLFESAIAKL